ncbi:uncharacterized protein [Rutidosis leptorrhynchoides]|uniref:uncharacterized protein n=1 Tax=Rutidosis leptorrhynchoides TaxID=125765 RepID=UPI003A997230
MGELTAKIVKDNRKLREILSLNVKGFGVAGKFSWVKGLCFSEKPDIAVQQLWGHSDIVYAQKDAIGNSGGMLVVWDNNRFKANCVVGGDFFLAVRGNWVGFGHDTIIVNVYGPHCDKDKKKMWEALDNLMLSVDSAWVLCGDFNEVREHSDRLNCVFHEARARRFNEFSTRNSLIEVSINGRKFTRISDDGTKFSKLDRFLVSNNFINLWDDLSINVLDRMESDHCPLILRDGLTDFGPKPFKIFDEWLNKEGIDKVIIEGWKKEVRSRKKDCMFRDKLKNVKADLTDWSKKEFGNLDEEISTLKNVAQYWELKAESGTLSENDPKCWLESRKN